MAKKVCEMKFTEFVESVRPSGAVNRFPSVGSGVDVVNYSIYLNGPMVKDWSEDLVHQKFIGEILPDKTKSLGLDGNSPRDCLKVGELMTLRNTYMMQVMEGGLFVGGGLSDEVVADFNVLNEGLTAHPYIASELNKQKALTGNLRAVLSDASKIEHREIKDVTPDVVSSGLIITQNADFTLQKTNTGEVVTHENRRLNEVPKVGSAVRVAYYRGTGQVVDAEKIFVVSPPFIEIKKGELAVVIEESNGKEQLVLFQSLAMFEKFVRNHGLDLKLVEQAAKERDLNPYRRSANSRKPICEVYPEIESGCLAVDYEENGLVYTALFETFDDLKGMAAEFNISDKELIAARAINTARQSAQDDLYSSLMKIHQDLSKSGYTAEQVGMAKDTTTVPYIGKVISQSSLHVAQDIGRNRVVIHDLRQLDKIAEVGNSMTVQYVAKRGVVTGLQRDSDGIGR